MKGCDPAGNPIHAAHPWLGGNDWLTSEQIEQRMPTDLKPASIPLTIVCGPPGSGKSTHVREHAGPADLVICLDTIAQRLTGLPEHHTPSWILGQALDERNRMLRSLAADVAHGAAWFIIAAPSAADRTLWRARLGGSLVVLDTPLSECIRRIKADPARPAEHHERMIEAASRWWRANPHLSRRTFGADPRGWA